MSEPSALAFGERQAVPFCSVPSLPLPIKMLVMEVNIDRKVGGIERAGCVAGGAVRG